MRNVSDKCTENQNTYFYSTTLSENLVAYEIMWTIFVQPRKPQMAMWHIRNVCRITKATDTHSGHVILIAFPRGNISYANAPQCYVVGTLNFLF